MNKEIEARERIKGKTDNNNLYLKANLVILRPYYFLYHYYDPYRYNKGSG